MSEAARELSHGDPRLGRLPDPPDHPPTRANAAARRHGALASPGKRPSWIAGLAAASLAALASAQEPTNLEQRVAELERQLRALQAEREDPEDEADARGMVIRYDDIDATFKLFGDVAFRYRNPEPANSSNSQFELGSIDLFANVQAADNFRLLSETFVNIRADGTTNITQMRLWAMWILNDQLSIKLGTEHSRISRYNQLFHHGRWLETAASRPSLAKFEIGGGVLPLHHTGLELQGAVHPEWGTLEYWAAVANGRGRSAGDGQTVGDPNSQKRLDAGLAVVPGVLDELRVGGSFTYDEIPTDTSADLLTTHPTLAAQRTLSMREYIVAGHLSWESEDVEMLGELAFIDQQARTNNRDFGTTVGYLHLGYRCGEWTPFARFDFRNGRIDNPYFAPLNRDLDLWEQILGVRYELSNNIAAKLQVGFGEAEFRSAGSTSDRDTLSVVFQVAWFL